MNPKVFKMIAAIPFLRNWLQQQGRCPSKYNPLGWMAQRLMSQINKDFAVDIAEMALEMNNGGENNDNLVVMEWGPGNGDSLQVYLDSPKTSRIYAVEISDLFRDLLNERFANEMITTLESSADGDDDQKNIENDNENNNNNAADDQCKKKRILSIHPDDAKSLTFLPTEETTNDGGGGGGGIIDIFTAMNVVYFLNPLEDYLNELHRSCKPGATVIFGASEMAKMNTGDVFVNTDWDICMEKLKAAGFINVQIKTVEKNGFTMNYISGRASDANNNASDN